MEQLPLDFSTSVTMRAKSARRVQESKLAEENTPRLFTAPPNLDVHLHSPMEAVAYITGPDPERTVSYLQGIVGAVRVIKSRRVAFSTSMLDRLLYVRPPANITLDASATAVARALWANKLGLKPLKVSRTSQRLVAYSQRWPSGFGVKDVPWPAIATLVHLNLPLDVDQRAKNLMNTKLGQSGTTIATAGLAGSAVVLEARMPDLVEALNLPALSYLGEPSTGMYKMPLLAAEGLLDIPSIKVSSDLALAVKKATAKAKPLQTKESFPWTLYPFQKDDAARAKQILEGTGGVMLAGTMGTGKSSPLYSKLLTPAGWTTFADIAVGDEVYGSDGNAHFVTGIFDRGVKNVYRVTLSDGSFADTCDEHTWAVYEKNDPLLKMLSLKHIMKDYVDAAKEAVFKYAVPLVKPINYPLADLEIESYQFGTLLATQSESNYPKSMLVSHLHAAYQQRVLLLQGLMDTKGFCKDNKLFFTAFSSSLFDFFVELVQSLGGTAFLVDFNELGQSHLTSFSLPSSIIPFFKNSKELEKYSFMSFSLPFREIIDVQFLAAMPTRCISVDSPDNLYVMDQYILVRNTTISLALVDDMDIWPLLVVAPLAAFSTWERQLGEMNKNIYLASDPPKVSWEKIEKGGFDVVVISYDRLHSFIELIERFGFKGIIADELQRIRTPTSRRSRAIRQLAQAAPYRIGLTGTPLQNRVEDLLPLGAFLAPGEWKPRASSKDLDDLYPGDDPIASIAQHLSYLMVRRRMEETGVTLPDLNVRRLYVELTKDQRRALEDLRREAEEAKNEGLFDDGNKMHVFARLQKMRQIISCPSLAGVSGPNPKVEAAINLAKEYLEMGRKGIIFCVNRKTWQDIGAALEKEGIGWTGIWGATSVQDRILNEKSFHNDPDKKIFIGTLASCAESLTLSPTATFCIFVDMSYSPSDLAQAEARAYRMNTVEDVDVTYLHATATGGTIDDRMVELLNIKKALFARVVDSNDNWADITEVHHSVGDLVYLLTGKRDDRLDKLEKDRKNARKKEEARKKQARTTLYKNKGKNKSSTEFHDQGDKSLSYEEWIKMEKLLDTEDQLSIPGFSKALEFKDADDEVLALDALSRAGGFPDDDFDTVLED